MKLFLDTANSLEIKRINALGLVDGVTTNPSIIAKEGRNFKEVIQEICHLIEGPVSAEIVSLETADMIEEAREISMWAENIVVKIPMAEDGLRAVKILSSEGIKINMTLVFTITQGILAAKSGATYISPFVGRLDDIGIDGLSLISDLRRVIDFYGFSVEIIAASLRSVRHVEEVFKAGAHIATIPDSLFPKLWDHPLTESGITRFLNDWQLFQKNRLINGDQNDK